MGFIKKILILLFLALSALNCHSQEIIQEEEPEHSPKKATVYSAVLPGLGQIYNKKYWKVPIIYVGMGGFAYFAYSNQQQFNKYYVAYVDRLNNKPDPFPDYNNQALLAKMDNYRKTRDLSIIGMVVFYAIQMVDANVDAHLFNFDISDDLSLKIYPAPINYSYQINSPIVGASCIIKF